MRAYYEDSSKQYGVNNLVYPGTAMPNVLLHFKAIKDLFAKMYQLLQEMVVKRGTKMVIQLQKRSVAFLKSKNGTGKLSKEEFDSLIYDLTNFLVYVGEPAKATRERIGWYVVFYFNIHSSSIFAL